MVGWEEQEEGLAISLQCVWALKISMLHSQHVSIRVAVLVCMCV